MTHRLELELPTCHEEQLGAFTTSQAREAGLTRHRIQRLLDTGRLLALRRGVYVERRGYNAASSADRSKIGAVAACLARPGSVISHHSAALIHGLPLLGSRPALPEVTFPPEARRRSGRDPLTLVHSTPMPPTHVVSRGHWSVTSVSRTACDIARNESLLPGLVVADAALAKGLTSPGHLSSVCDECATWPGSRHLIELGRFATGRSESPYETVARWQLSRCNYLVIPQVWGFDERGPVGCGDLWLPSLWVFVEIDGDVKYAADAPGDTLLGEKLRQERLEMGGFGVARVAARDTRNQRLMKERVQRAAVRGQVARQSMRHVTGFVGPPPTWAQRGTPIPVTRPSSHHRLAL